MGAPQIIWHAVVLHVVLLYDFCRRRPALQCRVQRQRVFTPSVDIPPERDGAVLHRVGYHSLLPLR